MTRVRDVIRYSNTAAKIDKRVESLLVCVWKLLLFTELFLPTTSLPPFPAPLRGEPGVVRTNFTAFMA